MNVSNLLAPIMGYLDRFLIGAWSPWAPLRITLRRLR